MSNDTKWIIGTLLGLLSAQIAAVVPSAPARGGMRLMLGCLALLALAAFCNREPSRDSAANRGPSRLEARFADVCPAGWRVRAAPFGNGRLGVNTVFRPATTHTPADRNILEMYFFDAGRDGVADVPRPAGWPDTVWTVASHDTDPSYPYSEDRVRVCWRAR